MNYIRSIILAVVVGVFANGTASAGTGPPRGEGCLVADPTLTPLNVRKSPNGPILGAINNGTLVVVMERRGDWVRIVPHEAAGKSGWVWLEYLSCSESKNNATKAYARANSPTLPSSMYGTWCQSKEINKTLNRYVRGKCRLREDESALKIDSEGIEFWESGCKFNRVTVVGRTYVTQSKCGGEGMFWEEKTTFWFDGGSSLMIRTDESFNELPELPTMVCRDHRSAPGHRSRPGREDGAQLRGHLHRHARHPLW